ncbi:MAG: hypothetical protein DCF19_11155 [Pseudanabaena frigida]|uniref:non-specific serine/threonine protein kinase n=1 Tax=Pseudanabaena frigida TaxID=945775 RepID=A0A2W4WG03_9CYAN|nr:MAG: hypothetical protein DCF19_11155 [Pseudanabaena frigida]
MIGKVIGGRYQIVQNLGSGGFGQTFLAEDLQLPDHHQCVVKHLKPATNDPAVLQIASRLFETEARVLHRLGSHDRIPRLLAHFEEEHEFYLVQELIEGDDLSNELIPTARSQDGYPVGRMNESQAIAFLLDVLEILAFVHQQGAIHRDIKPANLMRRRVDGKLVLIDFGAVKQVETATTISSTVAIGTEGYMPNEQAIGKPRSCSDLYAVGAIAIQGITGIPPSLLSENIETGELAWRESPKHGFCKYRANVSDEFAKIIDKLVKYDFRDRYQSAEDVLAAVRQLPLANSLNSASNHAQTYSQELTAIASTANSIEPTIVQTMPVTPPRDITQPKLRIWIGIGLVGLISAIAVISTIIFTRQSPAFKNSVSMTDNSAISPDRSITTNGKYRFLSERAITDNDLADKSLLELDIMRNEVFARYGRQFKDPELQSYFNSQPWYQPRYTPENFPTDLLTTTELKNVQYIREFQDRSAQNLNPSKNIANDLPDSQCDYTKRLISDPNPPINVRTGAGKDYPIAGTLDNGIQIKVEVEKQGWLKISAPIAGWVAANRTKSICF